MTLMMWTFLGIASFIYVYKKCGDLMSYANKEVLLSVLVFFSLGLVLSYRYHFRGPRQQQKQKSHLGVLSDVLSALPLVGFFWAKPAPGSQQVEQPKSRKVRWIQTWHMGCKVLLLFPLCPGKGKELKQGWTGFVFRCWMFDLSYFVLAFGW